MTFYRKDATGKSITSVHHGRDAAGFARVERAHKRVNALANPKNKKVLLKRNPPRFYGDVRNGMEFTYSYSRRAGK
jgi:hypothetical protein